MRIAGLFVALLGFGPTLFGSARAAGPIKVTFDRPVSTHEWALKDVNPALPSDWSGFDFLVLEFRASSSQRFELGLRTAQKLISKRIHPYPNVWVRASIPLRFYRHGLGNAHDLAATVNQPRNSYWINIEAGGHGPLTDVRGMSVVMRYPAGRPAPTLEIRSVRLAKKDPGDAVLEGGNPLLDAFGQSGHESWPGKARTLADLQRAWAGEAKALTKAKFPGRDRFGGFAGTAARATGFFRVERIDGRWWFVTPDGHLFYSAGLNGVGTSAVTRVAGREGEFTTLPAPADPPRKPGPRMADFYNANLQRRHGEDWRANWARLTAQRLEAWGLNTTAGPGLNDALRGTPANKPYVITLRGFQIEPLVMGLPDVYAAGFGKRIEAEAARQLGPRKNDPYLLGYFIGNEPPWPGRESEFVDLVLNGGLPAMRAHFRAGLAKRGDTPAVRRELVLAAFSRYLAVINAAVKKADPNHLNLGIRFGGTPPAYVVKLARGFDVYSLNKYRWTPPKELLDEVHALTGLPVLVGEFHFGVPARGLAPGLVQTMNPKERGIAYRYYVENAAAHPAVIGTHWFQWVDQSATGRPDGENYNIGWIDVTDRPYVEFIAAAKRTHARLFDVHAGNVAPVSRKARASEVGTPADTRDFGLRAIQ